MKIKDFVELMKIEDEDSANDECALCYLHAAFAKFAADRELLQQLPCPKCDEAIDIRDPKWVTIGETDEVVPEKRLEYLPLVHCDACRTNYGMFLAPVIYNANHDIYYTGGKEYTLLPDDFNEKMRSIAAQYTDAGTEIPWKFVRDMEDYVSKLLADLSIQSGLRPF